ncbi:hypothetical protein CVS47_00709 [Microbacterium lemovicicum]|uniref:DUF559 domain-containing protein n=1 Tax=Microbacterium lemovicicum TaxID=1072463 RepID=A0A3Q9IYS3_9MICO|nr:hypothetical protein [Microbacterium lemovicicum]AZS36109.1 hypothetical protein CVS47_00709 [Microbacterium lemovicicum]
MTAAGPTAVDLLSAEYLPPSALARAGVKRQTRAALVADGSLLRLRRGRYVRAGTHASLVEAGRLGGRLDCVSLLAELGVFVRTRHHLHLQFEPGTTRLPLRPGTTRAHWRSTHVRREAMCADLVEALAQACRCQTPRDAIATLDSAWHLGLVDENGVESVFARLPRRFRALRPLLDPRSEAGPETLVRLLLRSLGCQVAIQVTLRGVGRVDLVVDGWLIVECDSLAFHEGWAAQKRDRRRDLVAAGLGYTTIRLLAEDIMYRPDELRAMLQAVLSHSR